MVMSSTARGTRAAWTTAAALAGMMAVSTSRAERLVIPLTHPGKAVELEVSILMGSIKVTGGSGKDVVIEAVSRREDDDGRGTRSEGRNGMKRIPNTAIGLKA